MRVADDNGYLSSQKYEDVLLNLNKEETELAKLVL